MRIIRTRCTPSRYGAIVSAALLLIAASYPSAANAADIIDDWASVKPPPPPPLKPVTVDPKTTALMLLDFLSGSCGSRPRCLASLPAMKQLLAAARTHRATIIYSIAGKYGASDIAKEIAPEDGESVVKSHSDKFIDTDLGKILKDKGIKTVIVTGTAANGAVLYTGGHAGLIGLNVIIPVDGLSSGDLYAEQLTVWQLAHGPGFGKQVTITRSDMIKF
jgi:nicotinamidase-related amidase